MEWLDKLKKIKEESGETNRSIAAKTGIPQTTVEKLFSGRTKDPKLFMITGIMKCMGRGVTELLDDDCGTAPFTEKERELIKKIRQLDMNGVRRVYETAEAERQRLAAERAAECARRFSVVYYDFPVSAGTGEYMDYRTAGIIELKSEPPGGTSYVLRVSGNSMEPEFNDGDFVFVKAEQHIEFGEIGIFAARGSIYMKVYDKHGLRSLNPEYKLIPASEDIQCLGRVLGRIGKEQILW